jgi:hypothetical protein
MSENSIRHIIRNRERHCRWCARPIDLFTEPGILREPTHVKWTDGVRRQELFAFCDAACRDAYRDWETTQ